MPKKPILPTSAYDNTSNTSSENGNGSTRVSTKSNTNNKQPQSKTNCLFIVFAILTFIVSIININFHHTFHDEHVIEKSHREFQQRFQTSRKEVPLVDDYVSKRVDDTDIDNSNNSSNQQPDGNDTEQHKLAGLRCKEKYGGPEDEYAEQEMTFWSDIPSDASYKSPFLDESTERFLTFEP